MRMRFTASIGVAFCSTILLAQMLPPTLPPSSRPSWFGASPSAGMERRTFRLDGIEYGTFLTYQDIRDGPQWTPSSALPLPFDKAEENARRELRKLVRDDSIWAVSEFR